MTLTLGNIYSRSPSLRSSVNNSNYGSKRSKYDQQLREEAISQDKKTLMNSLSEHSANLKHKLVEKEKVIVCISYVKFEGNRFS